MFIEPILCAKLQAQCWEVNCRSMRSQKCILVPALVTQKEASGRDHVKQIITEANGQ